MMFQEFIRKLNEKEGTDKYRLPSETEWEYACRAGTTTRYSFGDDGSKLGDYMWYFKNSGIKAHSVGQKEPNPWGLYDMHGNVWERVQDKWHGSYDGVTADGSAWEGGDDANRGGNWFSKLKSASSSLFLGGSAWVIQGGSWNDFARSCRSSNRRHDGPNIRPINLGFRLLKEM